MLKRFLTVSCAIIAVMGAVSIMSSYDNEQNNMLKEESAIIDNGSIVSTDKNTAEALPTVQSSQANETKAGYVLMQCENGIAVYKSGESTIYQTIEFNVESLPQEDKRMLIGGIYVSDDKELQALIEDYTG